MKYKVKDYFVMKDVAGDKIVLARGATSIVFSGVLILNESCAFLWNHMSEFITVEHLAMLLIDEYGIHRDTAIKDTESCISKMLEYDILDTME